MPSVLIRFTIPYIYTMLVAGAYGIFFKKKIEDSLAPAFFMQIMIMLISAMACGSLTLGLVIGAILAAFSICYKCVKQKSLEPVISKYRISADNAGVIFITVLYLVIYSINYGSTFGDWDEFSHWGIFVKEMFRTDALYCTSPATMAHKDYVPAISIFETLWCKLSMRYSESDAYRGIQMLQSSMLLPLVMLKPINNQNESRQKSKGTVYGKAFVWYLFKIVLVLGIPIFFGKFYHTIYQDLIYGVLVFYCMYLIIVEEGIYKIGVLALSISILVLSKMTAMAFLPMLVLFYFVWEYKFSCKSPIVESAKTISRLWIGTVIIAALPVLFWTVFNKYVSYYVHADGGQSFGGISFQDFVDVVTHNGNISYQTIVELKYIDYLWSQGIVLNIPFIPLVAIIVVLVFAIQLSQKNNVEVKRRIAIINLWIILASIAYVLLMYYLYMTAFVEVEAINLASYPRYMGTMALAIVLLGLLVVFLYENEMTSRIKSYMTVVVLENLILFTDTSQLLPGVVLGEKLQYESESKAIVSHSSEDATVLLVTCGSNGDTACRIQYQCTPRKFQWMSPGRSRDEYDIYSVDMSAEEFVDEACAYNLLYLLEIDDIFWEEYKDAFVNPEVIENHRLYIPTLQDGKIFLKDVE